MTNFAHSLIPDNALEWIAAGMGLFVGMVFALDCKVPKNLASAVSDPRLKSLKYFVGGFVVALIADWQKIVGVNFEISKLRITGFYTIPFLLATLASLAIMSGVIFLQMRRIRTQAPEDYPDPPFNPSLPTSITATPITRRSTRKNWPKSARLARKNSSKLKQNTPTGYAFR